MKAEILKRAMFAMPLSKESRNSGIMSGFDMDGMEDEMDRDENAEMEQMPAMSRTPQNPEILMNNLRGDMRSVDARYQELAQMVGEEAAMDTPPEVLAMLQPQLAMQQQGGGIGALPQAQGMMPPGGQPPMGGAPAPAPQQPGAAMPQGGIPMPQGMESAPPFSQGPSAPQQYAHGGAVEPPTPDGMPPMHAFLGAFVNPATRAAQFVGDKVGPYAQSLNAALGRLITQGYPLPPRTINVLSNRYGQVPITVAGEKVYPNLIGTTQSLGYEVPSVLRAGQMGGKILGSEANAALGRMFMQPSMTQPFLENVRGPGGRYTAEQIARGGELLYPTFTQGIMQGVDRLAGQYPRLAAAAAPVAGILGLTTAPRGGGGAGAQSDLVNQIPVDTAADRAARLELMSKPPSMTYDISAPKAEDWTAQRGPEGKKLPIPLKEQPPAFTPEEERAQGEGLSPSTIPEAPAFTPEQERAQGEGLSPSTMPLGDFISKTQAAQEKQGPKTKMERIKEAQGEYAPLFEEIFGADKEAAKMNALLLLSEAGLKLATIGKPTAAMAVGEAFAGVPRGMAAIAAQERELALKGKTATLQQAITDVTTEDKFLQALKLKAMEGDYRLLQEQTKKGGVVIEDAGMGGRFSKTKDGGSFVGFGIDPKDPAVTSAVSSSYTLRPTDNPYVENRGEAPTTVETNKEERIKLGTTLRSLDNSLTTLSNLKGIYSSAYGPGAWFQDKVNNILVPIVPGSTIRPNFDVADASTRIRTGMNSIIKNIASANDSGRVAVQEQEWARETAKGITDPTKFFADKELAAQQFNSLEAMLRNARQQILTQLGYEGNDYVMRTPNTGTQNDPFVIPADPKEQQPMYNFLGSTIGKLQDPRATVYVKMPNGTVQPFNPTQLRGLIQ